MRPAPSIAAVLLLLAVCSQGCGHRPPPHIAAPAHARVPVPAKPALPHAPQIGMRQTSDGPVYIPPAPDRLPSLTPGQQFLCLPNQGEDLPYLDARNRQVPVERLALKLVTLKRIDRSGRWPMLYFGVQGERRQIHIENGGPITALPGLKPLVEDDTVRRLRAKYEGKPVWGYGGMGGQCVTADSTVSGAISTGQEAPYQMVHLVRIASQPVSLAIGNMPNAMGGDRASTFTTSRPLIAVLRSPKQDKIVSFSWSKSGNGKKKLRTTKDGVPIFEPHGCLGLYNEFADAWDFERTYSLISPRRAGRHWPAAMRKAVLQGELQVGMTPEMVAWVTGYPATYGTAAQIRMLPAWEYDSLPPFHYWVYFKNGKVSSFGPDGELP